jgi:hypothetical protein
VVFEWTGADDLTLIFYAAYPLQYEPMGQFYEIASIRPSEPPPGATGTDWHCYVIAFDGAENIHGYRQGSISSVTREVEEIVALVNERHWKKRKRA